MIVSQTITGIIQLTRYRDYVSYCIFLTILGMILSRTDVSFSNLITLSVLLIANISSTAFSFMINDIEDAQDDAKNPDKRFRNPISAKRISNKTALIASGFSVIISLFLFSLLGTLPLLLGIGILMLGWMYSYKTVRLKNVPVLDILSHALMLGSIHFVLSYVAFTHTLSPNPSWILPFLFIFFISSRGELFNEVRDYDYDKLAGLKHTAIALGKQKTTLLMYFFVICAGITLILSIMFQIIPVILLVFIGSAVGLYAALKFILTKTLHAEAYHDGITSTAMLSTVLWLCIKILLP